MDAIVFRIKQEVVYLEKEISEVKDAGKRSFVAFLRFDGEENQNNPESALLSYNRMRDVCNRIEEGFQEGVVHARLFDLNLISLLFTECSEENARSYLNGCNFVHTQKSYVGPIEYTNIGPCLYEAAYRAFEKEKAQKEKVVVSTNLSFQQNYLVDVVSRDRNEDKADLFVEAIDQAIQKYHMVVGGV